MSEARPLGEQFYNQNPEEVLTELALHSRHTPGPVEDHPELIGYVGNMLDDLTEVQRAAAETIGFASLSVNQAAEVLGKRQPHTVRLAWYRTVEKFTSATPPALEHERERKRRQRAKAPPKPRPRKYSGDEKERNRQRQKAYHARLHRIEAETGVTPPALAKIRESKKQYMRRKRRETS